MIGIGSTVGNYVVRTKLGQGGMGTVYLAEHPEIGSEVAIKVINPSYAASGDAVSRFFTEAKSVNQIKHHNIVDITDFGHTDDGECYYIMEFLGRDSLARRIDEGAMAPALVAQIAEQIANALAAAHERGIVHRDIKPDNVFLVDRGGDRPFVKVVDFGLVKLVGEEGAMHKTKSGAVMGTPYYMSPEQCNSEPDIGAPTDVYALGVIMYEMLTGEVPYQGRGFSEIVIKHASAPVPHLRDVAPACPPWLDTLVFRCLAKKPEDRPSGMVEVRDTLRAKLEGLPSEAIVETPPPAPASSADSDPYARTVSTRAGEDPSAADTVADRGQTEPSTTSPSKRTRGRSLGVVLGGIGSMGMIAALALVLWVRGGQDPVDDGDTSTGKLATKAPEPNKKYALRGGPDEIMDGRRLLGAGDIDAYLATIHPSFFYMDSIEGETAIGKEAVGELRTELRAIERSGEKRIVQKPRFRHGRGRGDVAWLVTAGAVEIRGAEGARYEELATTELLVRGDGGWRTLARHDARPFTAVAEKSVVVGGKLRKPEPLDGEVQAGAEELAGVFTAALGSIDRFAAALSDRPHTVVLGATWSSQLLGPAARKWMSKIASDIRLLGSVAAGIAPSGDAGWAAASIEATSTDRQRGTLTRPYRVFAVLLREGRRWRIVAAHFALVGPFPK